MFDRGQEQQITTPDGQVWTLSRLELRHIRAWRDWIKSQLGDPLAVVERMAAVMEDESVMPLLREAEGVRRDLESFSLGCLLAQRFMASEEGGAQLVWQLLRPAHPQATLEDAFAVAQVLGKQMAEAMDRASGSVPNGEGREASPAPSTGTRSTAGSCTAGPG